MTSSFRIAVLPGDGIGPEVMAPTLDLLRAATERVQLALATEEHPAGAVCWRDTGEALPKATMAACRAADAILLAAMGDPAIRYPDGTEIAPQLDLRFDLGLYAGVRPVRVIPGVRTPLADPRAAAIDLVILRESTEGLFWSRGRGEVLNDAEARDTLVITRATTARLSDFAFALARARRGRGGKNLVTCVDKANVFTSFAFFRRVFDERAAQHPDVRAAHQYIDAMALDLVRRPWDFDVMLTENMFGDILSDLGAALMGGMGYAPSADIGEAHAVFQPCHGSAPDIAGKGIANPTAMILSGAMMLEWLGQRHGDPRALRAGGLIRRAVDAAFATGRLVTAEHGGAAGTRAVAAAVGTAMAALDPAEAA
ncbi:isocitrate/isopropylmalate dehydrogenase family protein [Elioraea tepidiphila]|jgi:3-isopropylmalate dehydrogenase|uniref:isocitrate/isopropylmalate dehydrogenase family protein n=1 Tax=Elioraea tepidiphila TaxID=457934 RepID=UPI002FD94296